MNENEIREYLMNHPGCTRRIFHPCPIELGSLVERAKPWINKPIHIGGWHEIPEASNLSKLFPNDTRMGYVLEFSADVPESELNGTWADYWNSSN